MWINYLDCNCDVQRSSECVTVHYLCIQVNSNTLPCFFSLLYYCSGVAFPCNYIFYLLCMPPWGYRPPGKISRSTCHVESVNLWSVAYPGCLNPRFVQRAPGFIRACQLWFWLAFSCMSVRSTHTVYCIPIFWFSVMLSILKRKLALRVTVKVQCFILNTVQLLDWFSVCLWFVRWSSQQWQ